MLRFAGIFTMQNPVVFQRDPIHGVPCQSWVMMHLLGFHDLVVLNNLLGIGGSSPCKGTIVSTEEISTIMQNCWSKCFKLIIVDVGNLVKEGLWIISNIMMSVT